MFQNIGGKIKGLAKVAFCIGAIASVILGLFLLISGEGIIGDVCFIIGPVFLILGPILSWLSSFVLYGFGELVDCVSNINEQIKKEDKE